jgi:hypothetical protein
MFITEKSTFSAGMNRRYLESGSNMPGNGLMLHITVGKMNLILVEAQKVWVRRLVWQNCTAITAKNPDQP